MLSWQNVSLIPSCSVLPSNLKLDFFANYFYQINKIILMLTLCVHNVVQLIDWRHEFSKWWISEFKTIKIPSVGTVFNYFVDPELKQFRPWSDLTSSFDFNPEIPLQVILDYVDKCFCLKTVF